MGATTPTAPRAARPTPAKPSATARAEFAEFAAISRQATPDEPDPLGRGEPVAVPLSGVILDLAPNDWRYHNRNYQRLRIRVDRIRLDLSRWYAKAWLWIEGPLITDQGPGTSRQALIRVDAIPPALRNPNHQPKQTLGH